MIVDGSGSGKTNALLNLIKGHAYIDKIYLYAKDLIERKYEFFIKKSKSAGIKHLNDSKAFIECSNTMNGVYKNIDDYNPNRQRKTLIVFNDMISDIMSNKKFQDIIKDLFIRCRKIKFALVFITQSYFSVPIVFRLNTTHFLIMKINDRRELQNIAINHSAFIHYKDFLKIYRECRKKTVFFFDY